ncbi:DUF1471 domain-containing protein [Pantoea sp. B65]
MKFSQLLVATLLSATVMQSAFAAVETDNTQGKQKIGIVSASGAYSLDRLQDQLAAQADEAGASSYKIIAAGGENKLFGVAELYK